MLKKVIFIVIVGAVLSAAFPAAEEDFVKSDVAVSDENVASQTDSPKAVGEHDDLEGTDEGPNRMVQQDGQPEVGATDDLKGSETFGFGYYPRYYVGWGGYGGYGGYNRYGYGWGWRGPYYHHW